MDGHQDYPNRLIPKTETSALKITEIRRNYRFGREDGINLPQQLRPPNGRPPNSPKPED
jgi:hypothetical protein